MNLEEAQILAELYIEEHLSHDAATVYGSGKPWTFTWTNHKTTWGMCSYRKKEIQLSAYMTKFADEAEVEDTILHEIAHALTPGSGHGRLWKRMAQLLGANPRSTRAMTDDEKEAVVDDYKWVMILKDGDGKIIKGYYRKPNQNTLDTLHKRFLRGRRAETQGRLMVIPVEEYKRLNG